MRLPFDDLVHTLQRLFLHKGYPPEAAALSARLIAETSRDGVYSHGLNRVPRVLAMIDNGSIVVDAKPSRIAGHGGFEQWDGGMGPGNVVAHACMARTLELAGEHGIGAVALRHTNHWMRGGTYGWQAADAGFIGLCWTNTNQNLPPWGGLSPRIGNNPIVMALPRPEGHVVIDMAMSQFSYGALDSYKKKGQRLPVPGGFDAAGALTDDPAAIEESGRALPIGYWKGSALSIVLDLVAAGLSGGDATCTIATDPLLERSLSQVFIAIKPLSPAFVARIADETVAHLHASPAVPGQSVHYPGERTLATRRDNLAHGIPVDAGVWAKIQQALAH
ncbi:MAG: 3-dehydro-L-gulonate 2-dehydrogenase [Rhodothermales bacterium]